MKLACPGPTTPTPRKHLPFSWSLSSSLFFWSGRVNDASILSAKNNKINQQIFSRKNRDQFNTECTKIILRGLFDLHFSIHCCVGLFILFWLNIISIISVIVAPHVTTTICRRSSITVFFTSTLVGTLLVPVAGSITMQPLTSMVWPQSGGPGVWAGLMVPTLLRLIMPGLCATSISLSPMLTEIWHSSAHYAVCLPHPQ